MPFSLSITSQWDGLLWLLQLREGLTDGHLCDGLEMEAKQMAELHCPRRVMDCSSRWGFGPTSLATAALAGARCYTLMTSAGVTSPTGAATICRGALDQRCP